MNLLDTDRLRDHYGVDLHAQTERYIDTFHVGTPAEVVYDTATSHAGKILERIRIDDQFEDGQSAEIPLVQLFATGFGMLLTLQELGLTQSGGANAGTEKWMVFATDQGGKTTNAVISHNSSSYPDDRKEFPELAEYLDATAADLLPAIKAAVSVDDIPYKGVEAHSITSKAAAKNAGIWFGGTMNWTKGDGVIHALKHEIPLRHPYAKYSNAVTKPLGVIGSLFGVLDDDSVVAHEIGHMLHMGIYEEPGYPYVGNMLLEFIANSAATLTGNQAGYRAEENLFKVLLDRIDLERGDFVGQIIHSGSGIIDETAAIFGPEIGVASTTLLLSSWCANGYKDFAGLSADTSFQGSTKKSPHQAILDHALC